MPLLTIFVIFLRRFAKCLATRQCSPMFCWQKLTIFSDTRRQNFLQSIIDKCWFLATLSSAGVQSKLRFTNCQDLSVDCFKRSLRSRLFARCYWESRETVAGGFFQPKLPSQIVIKTCWLILGTCRDLWDFLRAVIDKAERLLLLLLVRAKHHFTSVLVLVLVLLGDMSTQYDFLRDVIDKAERLLLLLVRAR